MSQFYTNEEVSLQKEINTREKTISIPDESFNFYYDIDKCIRWITDHNFKTVCLQFPDYLLPDSTKVSFKIQEILNHRVYILGDTSYGSCCPDYIAAAHINADALIHFGPRCFSKASDEIPSLFIYEKYDLNIHSFIEAFEVVLLSQKEHSFTVVLDTPYEHRLVKLKDALLKYNVNVIGIDDIWHDIHNDVILYIGENDKKLLNFKSMYRDKKIYFYDECTTKSIKQYEINSMILKKRYFLIEKIKDSKTMGIIIGTLAVKNYLNVINRMKRLLTAYKKVYYLISVGKPTVAKLANFPEMDIYILIGCAMNEMHDSKEFFKPIATPYDVEMALNPKATANFSYDFNRFVKDSDLAELEIYDDLVNGDVSLLTGTIRSVEQSDNEGLIESDRTVSLQASKTVAISNSTHGAGYLAQKSWKGLEQNLGRSEVTLAEKGRKGIAQGYSNEIDM